MILDGDEIVSIILYSIIIFITGILGFIYKFGELNLLLFILKPVAFIVELFLGSSFIYYDNLGFVNEVYKVNIGRDCSGINFFIINLLMLCFSFVPKLRDKGNFFSLFIIVIASYVITILANASRIIGAILIGELTMFMDIRYQGLLHQSIGVVVYFIYLLATYILASKITNNGGRK